MQEQEPDLFYVDFETRFRGSRALIAERLQVYCPILEILRSSTPCLSALDLGCGRGEWLELLAHQSIPGRGIDCDAAMLKDCQTRQLQVEQNDALDALIEQPANSQSLISAFHLAEHLPFSRLRALIINAHRVLRPGGLLILETPNPENLSVGAMSFYMDPTHQRPIPPPLLQFAVQHAGFSEAHILRLQHANALRQATTVGLTDVLHGVSPDYAVLGVKSGPPQLHRSIAVEVSKLQGLTLQHLSDRFDATNKADLDSLKASITALQNQLNALTANPQSSPARTIVRDAQSRAFATQGVIKTLRTALNQSLRILRSLRHRNASNTKPFKAK